MPYYTSDFFLISIFVNVIVVGELYARGFLTIELLYAIVGGNVFNYVVLAILLFSVRKTTSSPPTSIIPPVDPTIQKLKQDILSLQKEINKMRTETEWKSEARSGGL